MANEGSHERCSLGNSLPILEKRTGVVVPVYFSDGADQALGEAMLQDTVAGLLAAIGDPGHICLSVDGSPPAAEAVLSIAEETGVRAVVAGNNFGKLFAVRQGMQKLLEASPGGLDYLGIVDSDGDHFPNELLNFIRAAEHVRWQQKTDRVHVLGGRRSRHRPMGFARGELEELADRILLDALHYDAAVSGIPLPLQFAGALDEFPDFHSGYKLFTTATANDVFLAEPQFAGSGPIAYYRHSVEAVIAVESVKAGAILTTVSRQTFDEQPVTEFGRLDRLQLFADLIVWPCKRLGVPARFVAQWYANHAPRLLLSTLVPDGRRELDGVRDLVHAAFDIPAPERKGFERGLFL